MKCLKGHGTISTKEGDGWFGTFRIMFVGLDWTTGRQENCIMAFKS